MEPTSEQKLILQAVRETEDNLILVARAGAAKTTTLEMVAKELPKKRILSLAFNKAIAQEMKERLPENCEARTLNSLGHRELLKFMSKRPNLRREKLFEILRSLKVPPKQFSDILSACRLAKQFGYTNHKRLKSLMSEQELFDSLEWNFSDSEKLTIIHACRKSADMVFSDGIIDFDDQILIPATCPLIALPSYDVVLVDEAQDLSALNHQFIKKLKSKRLIVAGDPLQAIYGFRGAHKQSMQELGEIFDCQTYKLTTSFRCSRAIIDHVKIFAPDIQAAPNALQGEIIDRGLNWKLDDLPDSTAIMCRWNSPLLHLSLELFLANRNPEYVGHDTLDTLSKILKGVRNRRAKTPEVRAFIKAWEEERLQKNKNRRYTHDIANCLGLLCDGFDNLQQMKSFLLQQRNSKGRIKLLTVHKAKGLEFQDTFILIPDFFSDEGQELNIQYVAKTRARNTITYLE